MKFGLLMSAMLATAAFCAAPTWAGWHGSANQQWAAADKTKAPKPSKYDITLTILEMPGGPGPCTGGEGWANICPSGDCDCFKYTGTASGAAGKGTVTFYETFDDGDSWTGKYDAICSPAYGDIEIVGSKDTESIAFDGADCSSAFFTRGALLVGGCYLQDTNVFEEGAVGSCSGNYSSTVKTEFTIKGTALK